MHRPAPEGEQRSRRVVIDRTPERSEIQLRLDLRRSKFVAGVVHPTEFAIELSSEFDRRKRGGRNCGLASISLFEIPGVKRCLDASYVVDLITDVTRLLQELLDPNDIINISEGGDVLIMASESSIGDALTRVERVCDAIAGKRLDERGVRILVAFTRKEPPEVEEYPEASAIICAYLPTRPARF